jgi:hypothetical protein
MADDFNSLPPPQDDPMSVCVEEEVKSIDIQVQSEPAPAPVTVPIPAPRIKKPAAANTVPPKPQQKPAQISEAKQVTTEMKEKNKEKRAIARKMAAEEVKREMDGTDGTVGDMTADALLDKHMEEALIMGCISKSTLTSIPETMAGIIYSLFEKKQVDDLDIEDRMDEELKNRESAFAPHITKDSMAVEADKKFLEKAITELRGLVSINELQRQSVFELSEVFGGDFSTASPQLNRQILHVLKTAKFLEKLETITDSLFAANSHSHIIRGFARILDASHNVSEVAGALATAASDRIDDDGNVTADFVKVVNEMMESIRTEEDRDWMGKFDSVGDEKIDLASKVKEMMNEQKLMVPVNSKPPPQPKQQQQPLPLFPATPALQPVIPIVYSHSPIPKPQSHNIPVPVSFV